MKPAAIVDKLGVIDAQIKELEKEREKLKEKLGNEPGEILGKVFKAILTKVQPIVLDQDKIKAYFGDKLPEYQKLGKEHLRVRIVAR